MSYNFKNFDSPFNFFVLFVKTSDFNVKIYLKFKFFNTQLF